MKSSSLFLVLLLIAITATGCTQLTGESSPAADSDPLSQQVEALNRQVQSQTAELSSLQEQLQQKDARIAELEQKVPEEAVAAADAAVPPDAAEEAPSQQLVTSDASSLALQLQDLSSGWIVATEGSGTPTEYQVQFATGIVSSLRNRVSVYDGLDEAHDAYLDAKQEASEAVFISELTYGEESSWYDRGGARELLFRQYNVVVWLQYYPQVGDEPDRIMIDAATTILQRINVHGSGEATLTTTS